MDKERFIFETCNANACGIYGIYVNEKLAYVGQSKHIPTRGYSHMQNIVSNSPSAQRIGYCRNLLRCFGENGFTISFKVIEECSEDQLNEREQYWIIKEQPFANSTYNPGRAEICKQKRKERTQQLVAHNQEMDKGYADALAYWGPDHFK